MLLARAATAAAPSDTPRVASVAVRYLPGAVLEVAFVFADGSTRVYGPASPPRVDSEEEEEEDGEEDARRKQKEQVATFDVRHPYEYIVIVRGCSRAHEVSSRKRRLAGIQFHTNAGRLSPWIGSHSGARFEYVVEGPTIGFAIIGLDFADQDNIVAVIPGPTRLPKPAYKTLAVSSQTFARPSSKGSVASSPRRLSASNASSFASDKVDIRRYVSGALARSASSIDLDAPRKAVSSLVSGTRDAAAAVFPPPPTPVFSWTKVCFEGVPDDDSQVLISDGLLQLGEEWNLMDRLNESSALGPQSIGSVLLTDKSLLRALLQSPSQGLQQSLAALLATPNGSFGEASLLELALAPMQINSASCMLVEAFASQFARNAITLGDPSLLNLFVATSMLRRLLQSPSPRQSSLLRRLLTPTRARNRPALGEYLFAKNDLGRSLMSIMAHREPDSLLRCFLTVPPSKSGKSPCLLESLLPFLEMMLEGEDDEKEWSLFRDALFRKYVVWGAQQTLAEAGLAGEVDWGLSLLRVLVQSDRDGDSILRLLIEGQSLPERSILHVLIEGYQRFLAAYLAAGSSPLGSIETFYSAMKCILQALARIEKASDVFKARWRRQWALVAKRVQSVADENSSATAIALAAPQLTRVCELVGEAEFNAAALLLAKLLFVEEGSTLSKVANFLEPLFSLDMLTFA